MSVLAPFRFRMRCFWRRGDQRLGMCGTVDQQQYCFAFRMQDLDHRLRSASMHASLCLPVSVTYTRNRTNAHSHDEICSFVIVRAATREASSGYLA